MTNKAFVIFLNNDTKRLERMKVEYNANVLESMLMATDRMDVDIVQNTVKICNKLYTVTYDGSARTVFKDRSAVAPMCGYNFYNNLLIARPCTEGMGDVSEKDYKAIKKRYVQGLLIMD